MPTHIITGYPGPVSYTHLDVYKRQGMRLKDKVIVITGSTTGIGKATAIRCVQEGAQVLIHGLEESWATELVDQLSICLLYTSRCV